MWYVYILYSAKLHKCYIGSTGDLKKRMQQHNAKGSPFTSSGMPWKLIYYEAFLEKGDALREERFLKTGQGRERRKIALIDTFTNQIK